MSQDAFRTLFLTQKHDLEAKAEGFGEFTSAAPPSPQTNVAPSWGPTPTVDPNILTPQKVAPTSNYATTAHGTTLSKSTFQPNYNVRLPNFSQPNAAAQPQYYVVYQPGYTQPTAGYPQPGFPQPNTYIPPPGYPLSQISPTLPAQNTAFFPPGLQEPTFPQPVSQIPSNQSNSLLGASTTPSNPPTSSIYPSSSSSSSSLSFGLFNNPTSPVSPSSQQPGNNKPENPFLKKSNPSDPFDPFEPGNLPEVSRQPDLFRQNEAPRQNETRKGPKPPSPQLSPRRGEKEVSYKNERSQINEAGSGGSGMKLFIPGVNARAKEKSKKENVTTVRMNAGFYNDFEK